MIPELIAGFNQWLSILLLTKRAIYTKTQPEQSNFDIVTENYSLNG